MRCAIYFIPPPEDPLTTAAASWLRRDPHSGARVDSRIEGLVDRDHAYLTAAVRRFGFHGTLKPPFDLAADRSIDAVSTQLDQFCSRLVPFAIPAMSIDLIDGTFALMPRQRDAEMEALATSIVVEFDIYRTPLSDSELGLRDDSRLNPRQFANLMAWGHPNVLDQFRFHMSLTGPVDSAEREYVLMVLNRHFADLATAPLEVSQVALVVEPEPHAPFCLHSIHRFNRQTRRKYA